MSAKSLALGLILLAGGGVAFAAFKRRGGGQVEQGEPEQGQGGGFLDFPVLNTSGAGDFIDNMAEWAKQNYEEIEANTMKTPNLPYAPTQISAMLAAIRQAEGTAGRGDPYRVCFGYKHTIASLNDHPAVTGEWRGEKLSDDMCRGAGFGPGCVSSAAGAYQMIKPTWTRLKAKLGLPDFSAASQDAAAVQLLRERGALPALEQGRFADAVRAARKEWASLPGAGYGQGERSIEWLTAKFKEAGGVLA